MWSYVARERMPVVPLYFARPRPVVRRDGTWIVVDDPRLRRGRVEFTEERRVRFRTLGCHPLTGAAESTAATVTAIIAALRARRRSERQGRPIDSDQGGAMEKKQEGCF